MSINKSITGILTAVVIASALMLMGFAVLGVQQAEAAACSYSFSTNLKQGSTGTSVMNLQKVLNLNAATQVSSSGAGSPGRETSYFGSATKAAVIRFQNLYASEVLTPVGLRSGTGFVGAMSRAKLNAICGGVSTVPAPTTGGAMSVNAASQPSNALAVASASRVPFTRVTLTAGPSDVTVNSITIERGGPALDAVFSGVVLLDEDGTQLGVAKALNSNHQASVGSPFTVRAGTSKTVTIAGNMATSLTSYAGQVVGLSVIAVNTGGTVSGSLPITGALHTVNASLSIGTATLLIASYDPNGAQSKEIGTTGYKFSGIKVTAGSAEQVRVRNFRWNQSGSAGSSDLSNVMVYVDGTAYSAAISSDGKYYTANFGSGIVIDKGLSKEIWVQGDVIGSSSAGRTVQFDVYKNTDIYITGETYGYGITPTAAGNCNAVASTATTGSEFINSSITCASSGTVGTPFFDGSKVTVSAGSITSISNATSVGAQNVAPNVPNQTLGGFDADIKGEAISVQQMVFSIATSSLTGTGQITSISLYGPNGNIVAGPVDGAYVAGAQTATFTDLVTFPIGKGTYTIKGKIPSTFTSGSLTVSTTPSSQWTTATGQTSGNSISLTGSGLITMNAMTVKSGALTISVSGSPAAQTVVAGTQNYLFTNYQLNTTSSGEDVRFGSIPLTYTYDGTANYLTSCQLFDGSTALNSGGNTVNPASTVLTGAAVTYTFDQSLTVPKGTVKTLALRCNISSSATSSSSYKWGVTSGASITTTGVTSGSDISETANTSTGPLMTMGSASYTITKASSNPSYTVVTAGTAGVTAGILNIQATNDTIALGQIALILTNNASSSASDINSVNLYDGGTFVGSGIFDGSATTMTVTLSPRLTIPKDSSKLLTIKVDTAAIDSASAASREGAFLAVDWDFNNSSTGTTTAYTSAGTALAATSLVDTAVDGFRMFKAYPTLAKVAVPNLTPNQGNDTELYRFSISAPAGGNGVGLGRFTLNIATTTGSAVSGTTTARNLKVYAYTDSGFATPISGFTSGLVVANVAELLNSGDNIATTSSIVQIPAGSTIYFKATGDVVNTAGTGTFGATITTRLTGDSTYLVNISGKMAQLVALGVGSDRDFVWSPNATTSSTSTHADWTNGYGLPSLPSTGLDATTVSPK
ncbi:MAG: hypothetical protein AAB355_02915 [Patescibacteria group bacterium]